MNKHVVKHKNLAVGKIFSPQNIFFSYALIKLLELRSGVCARVKRVQRQRVAVENGIAEMLEPVAEHNHLRLFAETSSRHNVQMPEEEISRQRMVCQIPFAEIFKTQKSCCAPFVIVAKLRLLAR